MSDQELQQQMDDMRSFDESMPQVGIFWYDLEEKRLFGVHKQELTPKQVEVARAQGINFIEYTPRPLWERLGEGLPGRVAWNINKFIVFVGQWAKPIEEELAALLEKEFALPYFEFVYDYHWDLGHGWSGDM